MEHANPIVQAREKIPFHCSPSYKISQLRLKPMAESVYSAQMALASHYARLGKYGAAAKCCQEASKIAEGASDKILLAKANLKYCRILAHIIVLNMQNPSSSCLHASGSANYKLAQAYLSMLNQKTAQYDKRLELKLGYIYCMTQDFCTHFSKVSELMSETEFKSSLAKLPKTRKFLLRSFLLSAKDFTTFSNAGKFSPDFGKDFATRWYGWIAFAYENASQLDPGNQRLKFNARYWSCIHNMAFNELGKAKNDISEARKIAADEPSLGKFIKRLDALAKSIEQSQRDSTSAFLGGFSRFQHNKTVQRVNELYRDKSPEYRENLILRIERGEIRI